MKYTPAPSTPSSSKFRYLISGVIGFLSGVVFLGAYIYGASRPNLPQSLPIPVSKDGAPSSPQNLADGPFPGSVPRPPVVMCMIFTTPEQWMNKALAVRLTWAKRCDFHKFFYSKNEDIRLKGAYALDVPEGRDHLTKKTMEALRISFNFYGGHVDWYIKADDDTYIIMENLKELLSHYDPMKPHYLGHKSSDFLQHGYNGGGASYILSHQAAHTMVTEADNFPDDCPDDGAIEDLEIGRCLAAFRIFPVDLQDEKSRLRFHPDHPIKLLSGDQAAMAVYAYHVGNVTFGHYQGIRVMSPTMVSFHYMDPAHMYMYDFLLYDLERPQHKQLVYDDNG